MEIEHHNTNCNFVVIKHEEYKKILDSLSSDKFLVRDRSMLPKMEGCIRITIGFKREMETILKILKSIV